MDCSSKPYYIAIYFLTNQIHTAELGAKIMDLNKNQDSQAGYRVFIMATATIHHGEVPHPDYYSSEAIWGIFNVRGTLSVSPGFLTSLVYLKLQLQSFNI